MERKEKKASIKVDRAFAREWLSKHGGITNPQARNILLFLGLLPFILILGFSTFVIIKGQYSYLFAILAFLFGYIFFQTSFKYGPLGNFYKLIGLFLWFCAGYAIFNSNYTLLLLSTSLIIMRWSIARVDSLAVTTLINESLRDEKFFCFLWDKDLLSIDMTSINYSVNRVDSSELMQVLESVSGK